MTPIPKDDTGGQAFSKGQIMQSKLCRDMFSERTSRRPRAAVIATLGLIAIVSATVYLAARWWYHQAFVKGVVPGPTLIEELQAGSITRRHIASVYILKLSIGRPVPRSEAGFSKKARMRIASEDAVDELCEILRTATTEGHVYRNHPTSLTRGLLRFELVDNRVFYVRYRMGRYENESFVSFEAASAGTTNLVGAKRYDNIPLGVFLKEHDPWFHDIDSPAWRPGRRWPNWDDTVP